MDLEKLTKKAIKAVWKTKNFLGDGADGVVYSIDNEVVLKLYCKYLGYRGPGQKCAEYEFELGQELHQQKVQVPEYFGLFLPVDLPQLNYWGVFMERIHGVEVQYSDYSLKRKAKRQHDKQIKLINKFGYLIQDSYYNHNTIFDVNRNKLFLIDLLRWERK